MNRKKQRTPIPPTPEEIERKRRRDELWAGVVKRPDPRRWLASGQNSVSQLVRRIGDLHVPRPVYLPPFQRPYVWTPKQAAGFLNRLMRGVPFGPTLLAERWTAERGRWYVVLDGQQRLTTIGAWVYRADGSTNVGHDVVFDCDAWEWTADLARRTRWTPTPREMMDSDWMHEAWRDCDQDTQEGTQRQYDLGTAEGIMERVEVPYVMFGTDAPDEAIIEAFVAINSGGTPWTAEDLERVRETLKRVPHG